MKSSLENKVETRLYSAKEETSMTLITLES